MQGLDAFQSLALPLTSSAGLVLAALVVGSLGWVGLSERRRRALEAAREAAHEFSGHGVLVVRSCGRVLEANGPARKMLWPEHVASVLPALPEPIRLLLADGGPQQHTLRVGRDRLLDLAIAPAREGGGRARGIILRDVTEERRGRHHLLQLAHYDSLTGLGNRRLFIDRLEVAIGQAREARRPIALFYIDIDRFKEVNDSLGHGAGDELLKAVAARFRTLMQAWKGEQDGGESIVARLSGDEFAIVAIGLSNGEGIDRLARSLLEGIAQPIQVDDRTITCSGSIGVSLFPEHGGDVEDLVKAADAALYVAKEQGRARHVLYEHSFTTHAEQSRKIEKELRQAIARGELQLHYQPKVDLESDTVGGFEALLRWYNAELGFVSPKDFIPIAEERGLICEIGAWCIEEACRQIRVWRDAGFATVPVSVNVSSAQFGESDLQRIITDSLVRHDVEPAAFEIELTESLILDDNDSTALTLRDLRAIGVRIALDDFGTGYSALTYLNRFPLDTVKMDRGFLRGIEDDEAAAGIASAVIAMSHSLGFEVVAEGVDSERQSELLRKMDCDQIQGFLYSPALPAVEAARFLASDGGSRPRVQSKLTVAPVDQLLGAEESQRSGPTADEAEVDVAPVAPRAKKRSPQTRALVIDEEEATLGQLALRMVRLGADVHHVQGLDEASVFVAYERPTLDLVVVPVEIDLARLASIRESVQKNAPEVKLRLLVIGEPDDIARRKALRSAGVDWLIAGPVEDTELRFFIGAARYYESAGVEQRAVRVPLETTAWIRAGGQRRIGTLTNLSRRGAFIETEDPYEAGQPIRLEFKAEEVRVRIFGNVTYRHEGGQENAPYRPSGIGVLFYEPDRDTEDDLDRIIEQIWSRHLP